MSILRFSPSGAQLARAVLANRWMIALLTLVLAAEIYGHVILPAMINTWKTREAKGVAHYAAVRQQAEAELMEQKALIEREVARNAEQFRQAEARARTAEAEIAAQKAITAQAISENAQRRQRAEAMRIAAQARKLAAEATTAAETARNAQLHKSAEAAASTAQSNINRQQLVIEQEIAAQSARLQKAIADKTELEAAIAKGTNLVVTGNRNSCLSCFMRH